jgi:hypothetical protein
VLLLDVTRGSVPQANASLPAGSRAAVFRYAWSQPNEARDDARLITAISNVVNAIDVAGQQPVRLNDVHAALAKGFSIAQDRLVSTQFEHLTYEFDLPAALGTLPIKE